MAENKIQVFSLCYHSGFSPPLLHYREVNPGLHVEATTESFTRLEMEPIGAGRKGDERCWAVEVASPPGRALEFYLSDAEGRRRDPAQGAYQTTRPFTFLQDGHLYGYWPAADVTECRRDYDPTRPPRLHSHALKQARPYRVVLPRGYYAHPERRYPVIYFQDGQNVFDAGPFGSWRVKAQAEDLMRSARLRECLLVGVDNTPTRLKDYVAPEDGGRCDLYLRFLGEELKPWIDSTYRTLPGPATTAVIGSSAGAVAALYAGWERPDLFGRVAALSGSWWLRRFPQRVISERPRSIRLYLDSGDQGGRWKDGLQATRSLYLRLRSRGLEVSYRLGQGHHHNEQAWAERVGEALTILFPGREEEAPPPLIVESTRKRSVWRELRTGLSKWQPTVNLGASCPDLARP